MSKKIVKTIKLQIPAGKANSAPPIGPALGQAQVNIPAFCSQFNEVTKNSLGFIIPVITKTPPASDLLKKAANIDLGSSNSIKTKVATIKYDKIKEIANLKMPDLNAYSLENACKIIMSNLLIIIN